MGVNGSGGNAVDPDAPLRDFLREALHEQRQAALGGK
jgi:hypothetical protein